MGNTNSNSKQSNMNVNMNNSKSENDASYVLKITKDSSLLEKEIFATNQLEEEISKNTNFQASKSEPEPIQDNSSFPYDYHRYDLPKDEEGYVQAFTIEQEAEMLEFFKKYGIVVVKDILTEEECKRSEDEIWEFIERHSNGVKRNDPSTYQNWPALKQLGILGNAVILSRQMCENRQNPKLIRAFQVLLQDEKVIGGIGRASAMRPTRNIKFPKTKNKSETNQSQETKDQEEEFEYEDRPVWKTISEWVHLDM